MHAGVAIVPVILLTVFFGLMFVAGTVGMILFFAGRPGSGVRRVGGSIALVCSLLLGGLLVIGTALFGVTRVEYHEQRVRNQQQAEMQRIGEQFRRDAVLQPQEVAEQQADAGLTRLSDQPAAPLADSAATSSETAGNGPIIYTGGRPDWIRDYMTAGDSQSLVKDGDALYLVFGSEKFSTLEEARSQLADVVKRKFAEDFSRTYHVSSQLVRDMSAEDIWSLAVRREYQQEIDHDFGTFRAPMYAVWWQVELSPSVRNSLFQIWKAQSQELRTLLVGGSLIGVTVLLAGVSLISRRRKPTPPPAPPPPSSAKASAVVLGVGAASLLAKRCRRWWKS